ncbi:MAG: DUF2949 domain-containing protein [Pseudanabaenaceae cyanobacterium bins.68]|nr:DUF2949 domain-containing protein [Pseudanabaenaceae cyanobacterium bins.68]
MGTVTHHHFNVQTTQAELEQYLLDSATINQEQLIVAKRMQQRQHGPLLAVLLQLSFINLNQFGYLLDWSLKKGNTSL